jgi:predicted transporter
VARRAKSSVKLSTIFIALLMAGIFFGSWFFISANADPFRTVSKLDIPSYLENANSLRGNVYKVEGEIVNSLAWSSDSGRLISIETPNTSYIIPVLVTKNFSEINIQKGQKFIFLLEVSPNGILRTKAVIRA